MAENDFNLESSSSSGSNYVDFFVNKESVEMHEPEGQLSVDVIETDEELVVVAPIAGTPANKVELHLNGDLLTVRGERQLPPIGGGDYHCHECYWGKYSRTIVLPVMIKPELVAAEYKNGILTVRMPKAREFKNDIPILVVED